MEKFHDLVKTKYVLLKIHYEYCEIFVALFVALSVCIFYFKICCIFPENFLSMEIKLELFSPEIVSYLQNKELVSHFRVYGKSAVSVQTARWITTDGPMDNNGRPVIH